MKPILYDANETAFTSQGIGVLNDCIECTCDEERNGMFECSLVYPISGQFYSEIKLDRLILVKASNLPTRKLQPFRIYKITKPISGKITVYARHISYELSYILVRPFTADTPTDALNGMVASANMISPTDIRTFNFIYDGPNDPISYNGGKYEASEIASIRSRLGGSEGSLLDIWHGEFEWDVKDVIYHVPPRNDIYARGRNRGVVFRYGGNITDMTQESDISDIVTRIYPYCRFTVNSQVPTSSEDINSGDDELSSGDESYATYETQQEEIFIELDEKYVDAGTISAYAYPRTMMLDLSNEIDSDFIDYCIEVNDFTPIKNAMKDIANEYIALQGVVNENNQISFIPPDDVVELCDIVTIENQMLNVSTTTKINKVSYNVLLEEYNSIEIGDLKSDFTESISSQVQNNTKEIAERYQSLEVDILKANGVVTDQLNAHTAQIGNLTADNATIKGTLNTHSANIEDLTANKASVQQLEAAEASIGEALIGKADVADLSAANANISNLSADLVSVKTLLNAGTAVIGQLQTIQLTASNTTVQQSFIDTIMANHAIIQNLIAGRIATGQIDTETDVGGIRVVGNTIQVFEKNGSTETVRMQIGKDGNGNFTFTILGSDGQSVLIDETGIHAAGIPDGVIVDDMVASADSSTGYSGIKADKLDINDVSTNVVTNINGDPTKTISSTQIYFDSENKTLNYMWSEMTNRVISAENAVQAATDALSGIDTLSSVALSLTNDVHIVHTSADGSTADYTGCNTRASLYLGTVDISTDSSKVTWNAPSYSTGLTVTVSSDKREVTVTNMTVDSGYVVLSATYDDPNDNNAAVTVQKRFNIVKIADGQMGESYQLNVYPAVMRRHKNGTFESLRLGMSNLSGTSGSTAQSFGYKLYYGVDGSYTLVVDRSTEAMTGAVYTPSSSLPVTARSFKIEGYVDSKLVDIAFVDITIDPAELQTDLGTVSSGLQELSNEYASTVTGPNGLVTKVGGMATQVDGVVNSLNKTLLYNITHVSNDNTTTCYAHVWKECKEVTSNFNANQFTWYKRDETGEVYLGEGYSITVSNADFEYTGVVVGRFTTFEDKDKLIGIGNRALAFGNNVVAVKVVET